MYGRQKVYNIIAKDYNFKDASFEKSSELDFTPTDAINNLLDQMQIEKGNIFKTRLGQEQKARIVAVMSYTDYVKKMNSSLAKSLKKGLTYESWLLEMKDKGLHGLVTRKGYWQTVFRTNIATAYNAGSYQEMQRLDDYIAYQKYTALIADHVVCNAVNHQIREKGGFDNIWPPNGYNCTGEVDPISKVMAERYKVKPLPKADWGDSKADEGFGNHPLKYLEKLPKSTLSRLPKGTPKELIEVEEISSIGWENIKDEKLKNEVLEAFKDLEGNYKNLVKKHYKACNFYRTKGGSHFRFGNVYLNNTADQHTIRHEFGHFLDYKEGIYNKKEFFNACEKDGFLFNARTKLGKKNIVRMYQLIEKDWIEDRAVSDIFCSLTREKIRVKWGHSASYYKTRMRNGKNIGGYKEVIANLFDLYYINNKGWKFIQQELPEIAKSFSNFMENGKVDFMKHEDIIKNIPDLPDIDFNYHIEEKYKEEFNKAFGLYYKRFNGGFLVNYIDPDISNMEAIKRILKAVEEGKPLKIDDYSFFVNEDQVIKDLSYEYKKRD